MKVQFKGNLTHDGKILTKSNGNTLLLIKAAENYNRRKADGSWEQTGTAYHYCVAYDEAVKARVNEFKKGDPVLIDGFTSILPATDKYPEREQIVITKIEKRVFKAKAEQAAEQPAAGREEFPGYEPLPELPGNELSRDYVPFSEEFMPY